MSTRSDLSALVRSLGEGLKAPYDALAALDLARAGERLDEAEARRRLEDGGRFLLGAVRAAVDSPSPRGSESLAKQGADLASDAEAKLKRATDELEQAAQAAEQRYARERALLIDEIVARVARYAGHAKLSLRLRVRTPSADKRILQLDRISPDEAPLLAFLVAGKAPSRYGFLFDDSTDDVSLPPAPLYPDEGVRREAVHASPDEILQLLRSPVRLVPIKGMVPMVVPTAGGERLYRLLQRGPVMEVELAEGELFRSVLDAQEAERFAGHLLRMKLEGVLELDVSTGPA